MADEAKLLDAKVKLFDTLSRLWAHADIYIWHRARIIVGVQAGTFAGAFAAYNSSHAISAIILLAGGAITNILHLAIKRDEQTRNSYFKYIDPLAQEIFREPLYISPIEFRMIPKTDSKVPFRAGGLIDFTFYILTIANFAVGISIGVQEFQLFWSGSA